MTEVPNSPAGPGTVLLLPPQAGNTVCYRMRLADHVLDDAPGQPMFGIGSDPKNIVVLPFHTGRCDQTERRIREHTERTPDWTRRLESVGFTVRPARRCGLIATCALPPTEALVERHGPTEEFTRKVTFPAYDLGGLLRLVPTHASANYDVLTLQGQVLQTVKELAHGVDALAVHFGLPDDVLNTTYAPTNPVRS
ncbi:hypothetical protein PV516_19165 [Streptomyces scabiei]|uniref:hypothetical protein n=1 Tax=Streptomyces scabiei TaxID=1930 RepID=UPI0029BF08CE|nr:hypothetical protein [Streptomyces scabiei]MDX3165909.1 hypothetical protein [Streptomyces scabiei]